MSPSRKSAPINIAWRLLFLICISLHGQSPDSVEGRLERAWSLSEAAQFDSSNQLAHHALSDINLIHDDFQREQIRKSRHQTLRRPAVFPLWDDYIDGLILIGRNLRKQLHFTQAKDTLMLALSLGREKLGTDHPHIARACYEYGNLCKRRNDFDEAISYLKEAIDIWGKNNSRQRNEMFIAYIARTYTSLGTIYGRKGYRKNQKGCYDRALDLLSKLKTPVPWIESYTFHSVGYRYYQNGDYARALEYLQKSLDLSLSVYPPTHPGPIGIYNDMGLIYSAMGEYEQALAYDFKVLELEKQIYDANDIAIGTTYNNIGSVKEQMGRYDEALEYLFKALRIKERFYQQKNHVHMITTNNNIGDCYLEKGAYPKAMAYYNKGLDVSRALFGDHHRYVSNAYRKMGDVSLQQGRMKEALAFYQKAIHALQQEVDANDITSNPSLENSEADINLLTLLRRKARVFKLQYEKNSEALASLGVALENYELAIDLLFKMRNRYKHDESKLYWSRNTTRLFQNAMKTARILFDETGDALFQKKAFHISQKKKSNLLAEQLRESKARSFSGIPQKMLSLEDSLKIELTFLSNEIKNAQKDAGMDSLKIGAYKARYFSTSRAFVDLQKEFERLYPRYYHLKYNGYRATVPEVQSVLSDEDALIEYAWIGSDIYIFGFTRTTFSWHCVPVTEELNQAIEGMLEGIARRKYLPFVENSSALYHHLLAPLALEIQAKKHLVIVPDGRINLIPFETLLTKKDDSSTEKQDYGSLPYLIRRQRISYSYFTSLYLETRRSQPSKSRFDFLAFAPVFSPKTHIQTERASLALDQHGTPASLPASLNEVRQIEAAFKQSYPPLKQLGHFIFRTESRVLLHRQATEDMIKSPSAGHYRFIHLATHGSVNQEDPSLSRLFFSPSRREDGTLYMSEVYNLKLNAELIVLSACETGSGPYAEGEGLINFTRGFLYAGAKNIMVSLWKVNDVSTSKLMIEFYGRLIRGESKSESLKDAKLALINSGYDLAMPFYWAPFILVGE